MQTLDFLCEMANRPQEREASIAYLAEHMHFLKRREKVLICFPEEQAQTIRTIMIQAVERCGAEPVVWKGDLRWKSLLRLAFSTRATTAIGAPIIILGLAKLARAGNTPLYIRNVVTAGYPCMDWMREGITKGLDCTLRNCFDLHMGSLIVGFSCEKSAGVHIREDVYAVATADGDGNALPEGDVGLIVLYRHDFPDSRLHMKECARISSEKCPCGDCHRRLLDIRWENAFDADILHILTYLHSWASVLDCSIQKGECGLELEIVAFPGEKLPVIPNCAKRVVREWNPETDEPMWYVPSGCVI